MLLESCADVIGIGKRRGDRTCSQRNGCTVYRVEQEQCKSLTRTRINHVT